MIDAVGFCLTTAESQPSVVRCAYVGVADATSKRCEAAVFLNYSARVIEVHLTIRITMSSAEGVM